MKKSGILALILICFFSDHSLGQSSFGQPKDSSNFEIKINSDFFLLGTFSDYMGRFQYIDRENQIDRYYPYEEPLAGHISNFINNHYLIQPELKIAESRYSEIFSSKLASQLHSKYFNKEGNFIDEKLDTDEKRYSFLLGAYYRYGEQLEGNIYKIQVANSPKDKQLYEILKDLESDKIVYKFLRGYRPSSDIFYFVATPRMIKYFITIKKEKEELQKSYQEKLIDKLLEGKKSKEYKKQIDSQKNILLKNLKLIFD